MTSINQDRLHQTPINLDLLVALIKQDIRHKTPTDLDLLGGLNKADAIGVVFLHTSGNGQNVRVKDDVIGVKVQPVHQQVVRPCTNLHFSLRVSSLVKWTENNITKYTQYISTNVRHLSLERLQNNGEHWLQRTKSFSQCTEERAEQCTVTLYHFEEMIWRKLRTVWRLTKLSKFQLFPKQWVNNCWWSWQNRTALEKCTHLYDDT